MQASISFLCQNIPGSSYRGYDKSGVLSDQPAFSQTYSLLPIVLESDQVSPGATFWAVPSLCSRARAGQFFSQARELGARTIVCEQSELEYIDALPLEQRGRLDVVVVPDAEQALLTAARAWRAQTMMPIIGVTGSVGKSTTKHMLATIYSQDDLSVYVSSGDQSSELGIACNILHLTDKHVAGVFEMGINEKGDMEKLVALLQPTMGIITSVSAAHLKGLGSVNEVALEKRKIFSQFSPSQIGIICGDYPLLTQTAYQHPVVRFGLKYKNMVTAKKVATFTKEDGTLATRCVLKLYDYEQEIVLAGNHIGTVYAALAASTVCHFLHTPFDVIVKGLEAFSSRHGCFELQPLRDGRGTVVNDCCTANPESVKAALHAVHSMQAPQKIAVLGNMPELGTKQFFWHRHVGRELIKTRSIKQLVLVGELAHQIGPVAPATMGIAAVDDWRQAHEAVKDVLVDSDNLVLVKGSSDTSLNKLVEQLV